MQNLIQIRQLPIIEEHLQQVKEEVTAKVKEAQAPALAMALAMAMAVCFSASS